MSEDIVLQPFLLESRLWQLHQKAMVSLEQLLRILVSLLH